LTDTPPVLVPPENAPGRILVAVNGDEHLDVLRTASAAARRHGADLHVYSCIAPPSDLDLLAQYTDLTPQELLKRMRKARLDKVRAAVSQALDSAPQEIGVSVGKSFVELVRKVMRDKIDLVIKSAEPFSGVTRYLWASTDQHLVRKCPCPVWLMSCSAQGTPRTVIAAVDVDNWDADEPDTVSDLNRQVLKTTALLTDGAGAKIHVLHAWQALGEGLIKAYASNMNARGSSEKYHRDVKELRRKALDALVRDFEKSGLAHEAAMTPQLVEGDACAVISEQAEVLGADLIVMGTVARTGLSGVIIGNTAEDILNNVSCSVAAVKPSGFVSPLRV